MGQLVIVAYRPRPSREQQLLDLIKEHVPVLRHEGLATDRPVLAMRAADGAILEIFEWKSASAIEEAHKNPAVQAMWTRFGEVCDFERLANLEECKGFFSAFEPIDL